MDLATFKSEILDQVGTPLKSAEFLRRKLEECPEEIFETAVNAHLAEQAAAGGILAMLVKLTDPPVITEMIEWLRTLYGIAYCQGYMAGKGS